MQFLFVSFLIVMITVLLIFHELFKSYSLADDKANAPFKCLIENFILVENILYFAIDV